LKQTSTEAVAMRNKIVEVLRKAGGAHTIQEVAEMTGETLERISYNLRVLDSEDRVDRREIEGRSYFEVKA
jgi:predicted transcriptional regulator